MLMKITYKKTGIHNTRFFGAPLENKIELSSSSSDTVSSLPFAL